MHCLKSCMQITEALVSIVYGDMSLHTLDLTFRDAFSRFHYVLPPTLPLIVLCTLFVNNSIEWSRRKHNSMQCAACSNLNTANVSKVSTVLLKWTCTPECRLYSLTSLPFIHSFHRILRIAFFIFSSLSSITGVPLVHLHNGSYWNVFSSLSIVEAFQVVAVYFCLSQLGK